MNEPRAMLEDQLPVTWDRATNATVVDVEGRKFIDFTSGIFVANVGHSHPAVIAALRDQLDHELLHTYTFPSASRQRLAKKLCEVTGYERAFLLTTGSEAVEAALRIARSHKIPQGLFSSTRPLVLSYLDSMHGKTLGSQQLTHGGPGVWRSGFPQDGDIFLPPHRPWDRFAAAILESYQGWSARFYPKSYVQEVAAWCKENQVLLIFDEVQAGFGRTGKLFAYEHYDVRPDMVCVGKGLGGGLPISAVLGSAELLDADPSLTSTHSGNPLCCAAALATLDVLEKEKLCERAARLGDVMSAGLTGFPYPVHGAGLVWAIDLSEVERANRVCELAMRMGLLLLRTGRGTIKIGPPLTIPEDELCRGVEILAKAITEEMYLR